MKRLPLLLLLAACPAGDADPSDTPATSGDAPVADATSNARSSDGADAAGDSPEPSCMDDYQGNQNALAALALGLDTSNTASAILGDGLVGSPFELGEDQLVVCEAAPSDFFSIEAVLPGYLVVEVRRLEGGVPDLVLHQDGAEVEHVDGAWYEFFLKPLQREVDAGTYVIEVRHPGGAPARYSLAVAVLPVAGP